MIQTKKIFFVAFKLIVITLVLLTIILFIYSGFFYENNSITLDKLDKKTKIEEKKIEAPQEDKVEKVDIDKTETNIKKNLEKVQINIKDGIHVVVGNEAITKSDIYNEIKQILILNNISFTEDKRDSLTQAATKSVIERSIKKTEVEKNDFLTFNKRDFDKELNELANNINMDLPTLLKICQDNDLDFSLIEENVKTKLLWNSLIFYLYRDRLSVNIKEIDEQLKLNQNKKDINEYLVSELVIKKVDQSELKSKIIDIENRIKIEGFENVSMELSLSDSASKGGNLGWINESIITPQFKKIITSTPLNEISEPIMLKDGILFLMVREKRKFDGEVDLEKLKNNLVNTEKSKILNMYSMSHYDSLRRSVTIKFLNE